MTAVGDRPIGFGPLKRKEDARFIRGKGTYLDDIRLPGMVHMAILRSPYAHAKINSIDTSAALALPGVAAVITAKDVSPEEKTYLNGRVAAVLQKNTFGAVDLLAWLNGLLKRLSGTGPQEVAHGIH